MRKQTFQHAEIRDENDNIISAGAYGKNTALSNKQNDGWVDYVMNNLERLYEKGKTDASTMTKELAKKAEKADVYTKSESDERYQAKGDYATNKKVDDLLNLLKRNKSYRVGDIVNSAKLPSDMYLECVQAGTTGSTEPELSTGGAVVNDGSCKFRVMDKRMKAMIDILYPIGIVITTATDNTPKPGEEYGLAQWEQVGEGRSLIGAGTGTDQNGKSMTFSIGQQGGEYEHKLTISEMPTHDHAECINGNGQDSWNNSYGAMVSLPAPGSGTTQGYGANVTGMWNGGGNQVKTKATGGNHAHNNIQPYLVAYFWKRIK